MRVRIWNAFASNNSGSYVIIGTFMSEGAATEAAAELLESVRSHSKWLEAGGHRDSSSPLAALAAKYSLPWKDGGPDDDWPCYSNQEHPPVWSIGHQVFVHSDYTITMPKVLGQFMYARGGRVETEIDHAHHPIVSVFEIWFPWQQRKEIDIEARTKDIVDGLCAATGPFAESGKVVVAPAWRKGAGGFGDADLVVGAVFEDLCAGFRGVSQAVVAQGAGLRVRLMEALPGQEDPFSFLRPCSPRTRQPLVDVLLEEAGLAPTEVTRAVAELLGTAYDHARRIVDAAPIAVVKGVHVSQGNELAKRLAVGLAKVTLRKSDDSV